MSRSLPKWIGIALARLHAGIAICSYLYSALKRKGLLDLRWPEMQAVIKLQIDNIFPHMKKEILSPSNYHKCFRTRMGFPLKPQGMKGHQKQSVATPDCLVSSNIPGGAGGKADGTLYCLNSSQTSDLLTANFDGDETMVRTVYAVDAGINEVFQPRKAKANQPAKDIEKAKVSTGAKNPGKGKSPKKRRMMNKSLPYEDAPEDLSHPRSRTRRLSPSWPVSALGVVTQHNQDCLPSRC